MVETDELQGVWRLVGDSVRGARHVQSDLPNQDAFAWDVISAKELNFAAAVADGHGDARCFRSEIGSRVAVETALAALREYAENLPKPLVPTLCKRQAEERLPIAISRLWKEKVQEHLSENPISEEELDRMVATAGESALKKIQEDPAKAYGCTVLASLVHPEFLLLIQVGDGEILMVTEGAESVRPLSDDPRNFANETTSLSSEQSSQNFRVAFVHLAAGPPALILLCTDGYSNAHSEENLRLNSLEWVEDLRTKSVDAIKEEVRRYLDVCTERGTGDDTTLVMLFRMDANEEHWPDWRAAIAAVSESPKDEAAEGKGAYDEFADSTIDPNADPD